MADALAVVSSYDQAIDLRFLLDRLLDAGRLTAADVERVTTSRRSREEALLHPVTFLASLGLTDSSRPGQVYTEDSLMAWLAQTVEQPYYRIDPLKIDVAAVTEVMSLAFARHHKILAVDVDTEVVEVASAEPFIGDWVAGLEQVTRKRIKRVLAMPGDILRYTGEFYTLSQSITGATAQGGSRGGNGLSNLEQMLELGSAQEPDANDQHIVSIVDWLLQYAFDQRVSDIHLEPRRDIGRVRFRIDGVLHAIYELPAEVAAAVTSRVKILGRMDLAEKRRPQDGRLKTRRPDGSEVELRLSTLPRHLAKNW